jgi:hypothetical protein
MLAGVFCWLAVLDLGTYIFCSWQRLQGQATSISPLDITYRTRATELKIENTWIP